MDAGRRKLLGDDEKAKFDASDFAGHAVYWLIVSALASFAVAAGFLHLVRNHAETLARATIGFQLALPTAAAIGLLLSGAFGAALIPAAIAGLTFVVFYLWRREIGVASKLLSVAGHGLFANGALIGLTVALNFAAMLFALPPLIGAIIAFAVGDVVPNPLRDGREACVDQFGTGVSCCAWQPKTGAQIYMGAAGFVAAWTMLTLNQIRVYTVSGTVAQWYFAPPGAPIVGNAMRSLKHALTTSLGTNIFAGLVLTFTQAVKNQQQQDQANGDFSIIGFLASCLASIYEYLTKFATVFSAISGDGLVTAGKRVTDLLMRSMLEAFATTIWFPSAMMTLASITISALYGSSVYLGYRYLHHTGGEKFPVTNAVVLGILVGVVTLFVLSFLIGVLLSVLDAVFVCFAIDKDRQAVANAEMYESLLGIVEERGIVVESPDGRMEFGTSGNAGHGRYQAPGVAH